MLSALELHDFVLAERVRLETHAGLNVLTGETGAGKSLLVDALGLLTGARAEAGLVRHGAERALVQAEFDGDGPASASRALVAGGRNHARLDGELVTLAELADAVGARVAVFAQHAHQALLSPAAQREALDRLLPPDAVAALRAYRTAWSARRAVDEELATLRERSRERLRRAEMLDAQIAEIDAAQLEEGEEARLEAEARRLRHADRIAQSTAAALAALDDEAAGGAVDALLRARRSLDDAARHDERLDPLARDLADAAQGAQAVATELQGFLDDFAADPARLDAVEARLTALQRLFAKYGDGSAEVLAFRRAAADERTGLDRSERRIDELGEERRRLDAVLAARAAEIRAGRSDAGDRLAREAAPLLSRLALAGARLEVALDPAEPGPHGTERVRFAFAADPGEPLAPLSQAASGGELSRVMLALWLVTGSDRPTLVFDEVDAGVGGRAAAAVGELLAELGRRHQVLVVTHLAQVAAHADRHVHVGKAAADGRTTTTVTALEEDGARERELARMLAGHDGDAARAAARELLARARGDGAPPDAAGQASASASSSASTSDASE